MQVATLPIAEETVVGMRQVADNLGTTVEVLADKAIRRYLRQEAEKKIRREEQHFRVQHTQLLDQYASQFIAMHEGKVIDSDADELALYLRIRQKFPMVGVLIRRVTPDTEDIWVMRSPGIEYD
ncbi:MAG: hypothetical protein SXV54_13250 [Chloroflexota bacterium]|nr:hypothetical protein [Chloroflexota bacterium]